MSTGEGLSIRSAALPMISTDQMVVALDKYRELQTALDKSMPDQIMDLDGKKFRKKGYWRAVALAFGLEVEKIEEKRDVAGRFNDGRDNFGYVVTYKATNQAGRSMTGDGACFAVEKARRFKCPHPESPGSRRTLHFPHNQCPDFDPEFQWKALPGEATEHNVRSHANTRAYNRAVSNLVGFGEVSAEEVEREEHGGGSAGEAAGGAEPRQAGSGRSEAAQAAAGQGSSQGTSAPAAGSGGVAGATTVKNVTRKEGKNSRGPWTLFTIFFDDGRQGKTFSTRDGEHAENAKKSGAQVIPRIKKTDKGFDLEGFEEWPKKEAAKEEHPNAHQDDPVNGPEKILTVRKITTDAGIRWAIQTDKRVVLTDKEQHEKDAQGARAEGMGLTPRIEVIENKNRLIAWEETAGLAPAEEAGSAAPAEPAAAQPPPAEPEKKGRGGKKGSAK